MAIIVSYNNMESGPDSNIREITDTRTYIADPRDSSNSHNRIFVYDSDPFDKSLDFQDLPYIVLKFPTMVREKLSADGKTAHVTWEQNLIVRSKRDGANGTNNKGRTDFMNIKDDVIETFNSLTVHNTLKLLNIKAITLEKVSDESVVISEEEIYEAEFKLTYSNRMTVSS